MAAQMGLASVFRFGKYKGLTVAAVIRFNPGYLAWLANNMDGIDFDADARRLGQAALNVEREASFQRQNGWAWGFGREVKSAADKRRSKLIRIEHDERRKAGQTTCACFPDSRPCSKCNGAGWIHDASAAGAGTAETRNVAQAEGRQSGAQSADAQSSSSITPNGA